MLWKRKSTLNVSGIRGRLEAKTHNGGVHLTRVAGDVTDTYRGWKSYRGLLSAAEVEAAAADLATVTVSFLRQRMLVEGVRGEGPDERSQENFDYVSQYLADAQAFLKEVASEGRAIVYYIG